MKKLKSAAEFLPGLLCLAILTAFLLTFFHSSFVLADDHSKNRGEKRIGHDRPRFTNHDQKARHQDIGVKKNHDQKARHQDIGVKNHERDKDHRGHRNHYSARKWYDRPAPSGEIVTFTFYDNGVPQNSSITVPQNTYTDTHVLPAYPEAPPPPVEHTADSLYNAGFNYYNAGDYQNAADYFTAVINNYSGSPYYEGAMYYLAKSYDGMDKYAEAADSFERMISVRENSPSRPGWFFELAGLHNQQMRFEEAARCYENFEREYPDHDRAAESIYCAGQARENAFDRTSAADSYRSLISKHPASPFAELAAKRLEVLN